MRNTDQPNLIESLESRRLLSSDIISAIGTDGGDYAGNLSGRTVFINGGHGLAVNGSNWQTGRGDNNDIVEDFGNQDQLRFFADYLLRAGAAVVPLRPIGHQVNEVIVDNDDPGVVYNGSWANSSTTSNFYGTAGDVGYRFATKTSAATPSVTFNANVPEIGEYPVYAWVLNSSNRGVHTYTINHSGGDATVKVDHSEVGGGWVYLGTYNFDGPASVNVRTDDVGKIVIADAIRFGNGMGDINRGTGVSGRPREDEASLYWIESSLGVGVSMSQFRSSSNDGTANVGAPPRYAAFMNAAAFGQSLYISFHTNAGGGSGRGVLTLHNTDNGSGATPNQLLLAQKIGRQVNDQLSDRDDFEFAWNDRGNNVTLDRSDIDFGEISSGATGNEFDATIVEVGFHDNVTDAALLLDPKVRDAAARATYHGVIDYFAAVAPLANSNYAPDAPNNVRALKSGTGVQLGWEPQSGVSSYEIQASLDGKGFDTFATSTQSFYTASAAQMLALGDAPVMFRIVAKNAAGSSIPSRVVAGQTGTGPRILIVNGFNRLGRFQNPLETDSLNYNPPGSGTVETYSRVRPTFSNTFDYVTAAAAALPGNVDWQIDTAQSTNIEFGTANLQNYAAVIWLAGEESTGDLSLSFIERSLIAAYVNNGGNIFLSGSEVAWDIATRSGSANNGPEFLRDYFGVQYATDDAGTYNISGGTGVLSGVGSFSFDDGDEIYDVDFPDTITATNGGAPALRYSGNATAGVSFDKPGAAGKSVFFGFPFETITSVAARAQVMTGIMAGFNLLDTTAPLLVTSARNVVNSVDLVFQFSEPVTAAVGNLVVAGPSGTLPAANFMINGVGTNKLTFTYAPNGVVRALPNGNFTATLSGVKDPAGNTANSAVLPFYFLMGDVDGDRDVDLFDAARLERNFGRTNGPTFAEGDLDFDDDVDLFDAALLERNFGTYLAPPVAPIINGSIFGKTRISVAPRIVMRFGELR